MEDLVVELQESEPGRDPLAPRLDACMPQLAACQGRWGPSGVTRIGAIMNHPREWFQPKVVGIGWSPRTWEGWAIIASVIAIGAVIGRVNF